jgi:flagellar secretion chaperone FliS
MIRANAYKNIQASTASKERLMALLFEAALRHMRQSRAALERKDLGAFFTGLEKASAIVIELKCTLKPEVNQKLCDELKDLYGFVIGRLVKAGFERKAQPVGEAERAFAPVAEAFVQAAAQVQSQQSAGQAQAAR